jgi:phage baseplate assembly protein W
MATIIQPTAATPIGITLPIEDGNSGYFAQSYDTLTQVKMNILNLLNTRPGERRFQPTFGSRLWNLVFEQNISTLKDQAIKTVTEDVSTWIPNVALTDITTNILTPSQITTNTNIYMLEIAVSFIVNLTKQSDVVVITINNATY